MNNLTGPSLADQVSEYKKNMLETLREMQLKFFEEKASCKTSYDAERFYVLVRAIAESFKALEYTDKPLTKAVFERIQKINAHHLRDYNYPPTPKDVFHIYG